MSTAKSALLVETANYRQLLELRPCDALHPLVEIRISSWYTEAKNPECPQERFRTLVAPEALLDLRNALEALLTCPDDCRERDVR